MSKRSRDRRAPGSESAGSRGSAESRMDMLDRSKARHHLARHGPPMCWRRRDSTKSPLKSSGRVKQVRKPCIARSATGCPASDVFGCSGGRNFPLPRTCPPFASVETSPGDLKLDWMGKQCPCTSSRRRLCKTVSIRHSPRIKRQHSRSFGRTPLLEMQGTDADRHVHRIPSRPASWSIYGSRPKRVFGFISPVSGANFEGILRRYHQAEIQPDTRAELYEQRLLSL